MTAASNADVIPFPIREGPPRARTDVWGAGEWEPEDRARRGRRQWRDGDRSEYVRAARIQARPGWGIALATLGVALATLAVAVHADRSSEAAGVRPTDPPSRAVAPDGGASAAPTPDERYLRDLARSFPGVISERCAPAPGFPGSASGLSCPTEWGSRLTLFRFESRIKRNQKFEYRRERFVYGRPCPGSLRCAGSYFARVTRAPLGHLIAFRIGATAHVEWASNDGRTLAILTRRQVSSQAHLTRWYESEMRHAI